MTTQRKSILRHPIILCGAAVRNRAQHRAGRECPDTESYTGARRAAGAEVAGQLLRRW